MKRVLVTGGAGFIGSHLVDKLVERGFEVSVLDNFSSGKLGNLGRHLGKIRLFKGDVRDADVAREAARDAEVIYHLAAITSVPYSVKYPDATFKVNVEGTRNLLEACAGAERFIFVSSCAVYGQPMYLPIDERHPTVPISPYGKSKLEAEKLCREFQEKYGLKVVIVRPFNVYGTRMRDDRYGGVIARFIKRLGLGRPPIIYGDGEQTRDFVYVDDVVDALILALDGRAIGKIFNIASGVPTSINSLAKLIMELLGRRLEPRYRRAREGDIRHSYADIKQLRAVLGYEPRFSLKEGLSALLAKTIWIT